jgi:hypothetical protein
LASLTQKELFRKKWEKSNCRCEVCDRPIHEPLAQNFAHVLSKGAYPRYKFKINNLWLLCFDCHYEYDHGVKSSERFDRLNEYADQLRMLYCRDLDCDNIAHWERLKEEIGQGKQG